MFFNNKIFLLIISFLIVSTNLNPQTVKKLTIKGLLVYTEDELYTRLDLKRFEEGKIPLAEVISLIEKFYRQKKYPLVKVYSTDIRTTGEFTLFVDEGRLGRIVVQNLNNYYSLRFKREIDIPKRVYNTDIVDRNLLNLKTRFKSPDIAVELRQPADYEGNLIQLDRELERLKLGEIFETDFFDRYLPRHDLHFIVIKKNGNGSLSGRNEGFGFNINYKFPSVFIPEIYHYNENTFAAKDYLESSISAGIDPGFKGIFSYPPSNTLQFPPEISFVQLTGEYKISPMQNDFIGPLLRGKIYHSAASRVDLGITEYNYLNTKITLAPEFTILKNLNIYAGLGTEQITVYDTSIDYEAEKYLNTGDDIYHNTFAEARLKFDPIPIRIGNRLDKYMLVTYTRYLTGNSSHRFEILAAYDTEFFDYSILSLRSKSVILAENPPFYQSEGVNNTYFKGFPGDNYYTDSELSLSGEYRFSIYRDFIYVGAFAEWIVFEPEGYILSGTKYGINFGPCGRLLVYDQFEVITYFGYHRLLPDNKTGTNFQVRLSKKW